jgi:hypothetical protein
VAAAFSANGIPFTQYHRLTSTFPPIPHSVHRRHTRISLARLGARVTGIDASSNAITSAQARISSNVTGFAAVHAIMHCYRSFASALVPLRHHDHQQPPLNSISYHSKFTQFSQQKNTV